MPEGHPHTTTRATPTVGWTVLTDAPLRGLALAREAGRILAWDESHQLYLFDLQGDRLAVSRAPGKVVTCVAGDSQSLYVVLGEGGMIWFLGEGLEPIAERSTGIDAAAIAVDPHGRYVAIGAKVGSHALFTRYGKPAGQFETKQPVGHLAFVPDSPLLIAASNFGTVMAIELMPTGSGSKLDGELAWQQSLLSNVGRLALTGDGRMILASCFTHGVHRFDLEGNIEGAYHLEGSATHAVPDFVGRTIAVATIESSLFLLNSAGNVRWQTGLSKPAIALQVDALGRYVIYGQASGEITRLDIEPPARKARPAGVGTTAAPKAAASTLRQPDWTLPVAQTEEQAEFAVLAVLDEPARIGYMTTGNRLQLYTTESKALGQAPEMGGVGRTLRTTPGWIAAATDRNLLLFDARRNGLRRLDLNLVELTQLALLPDTFGLALVQERDRIGRASAEGDWRWKRELDAPVEEIALDRHGRLAATLEDGRILVFDSDGQFREQTLAVPPEGCLLIEAPEGSPLEISWLALARRSQWVKGLDSEGRSRWEYRIPFEAWQFQKLGPYAIITSPDGRAVAIDGAGRPRGQGEVGIPHAVYTLGPKSAIWRITRQDVNLRCTDLAGRAVWRAITDDPLGPMAAGTSGIVAMVGRNLAWFGSPR